MFIKTKVLALSFLFLSSFATLKSVSYTFYTNGHNSLACRDHIMGSDGSSYTGYQSGNRYYLQDDHEFSFR